MINKNFVNKEEWKTSNELKLEDEAKNTVINDNNTLVIAGPGAGKTELLAQRACFLLETNTCKYPKKILAISFKKDASENLKQRVELRCGKELSSRFESKTYDAFAKEILDRFRNSLNEEYRPKHDYSIAEYNDIRKAFKILGLDPQIKRCQFDKTYGNKLTINRLPLCTENQLYIDVWKVLLKGDDDNCAISFEMISRLAEYLIRTNKYIKRAIEMTYSHLFLDEFQDTTSIQYDLIKTCFLNTRTVITAVGDGKQRIMRWAGARESIFEDFQNDFGSEKRTLIMNHRSAPRLVKIQRTMYSMLNEEDIDLRTNEKWKREDGEAYLRFFDNDLQEADIISREILRLKESEVPINEICILVKQKVDEYSSKIISKLSENGIKARNETVYQSLLKEDVVKILISFFRLALYDKSPDDWNYIYDILSDLNGINENYNNTKFNEFVSKIDFTINQLKNKLQNNDENKEKQFNNAVDYVVDYISYKKLASVFQKYKSKYYFDELIQNFKKLVWNEYNETKDFIKAIDNFEGKNSIPIMTIHKSKGLEYDTIFFVGLEDAAFWNFKNQQYEDKCAFFVALSRAKRRIDFTFSSTRKIGYNNSQSHEKIDELYDLLDKSGLVIKIRYVYFPKKQLYINFRSQNKIKILKILKQDKAKE